LGRKDLLDEITVIRRRFGELAALPGMLMIAWCPFVMALSGEDAPAQTL
jgi:hypothetical protein